MTMAQMSLHKMILSGKYIRQEKGMLENTTKASVSLYGIKGPNIVRNESCSTHINGAPSPATRCLPSSYLGARCRQ